MYNFSIDGLICNELKLNNYALEWRRSELSMYNFSIDGLICNELKLVSSLIYFSH